MIGRGIPTNAQSAFLEVGAPGSPRTSHCFAEKWVHTRNSGEWGGPARAESTAISGTVLISGAFGWHDILELSSRSFYIYHLCHQSCKSSGLILLNTQPCELWAFRAACAHPSPENGIWTRHHPDTAQLCRSARKGQRSRRGQQ